jgi:hypothetical protein
MAVAAGALAHVHQVRELETRVSHLCGRINALEGELAGAIGELFQLKAYHGVGWRSPGHYVGLLLGSARSRTSAMVAAASAGEQFPATIERLKQGEISLDQAAAIVRVAPAWADRTMAEAAGAMTPAQLSKTAQIHRQADDMARAADQPADSPSPKPPPVDEFAQFNFDDVGSYRGRFRLDADRGAEFEATLKAHFDALWQEWKAQGGAGPFPKRIDAFMRMVRRSAEADAAGLGGVGDHRRHLVVLHVDVSTKVGHVHMGPVMPAWAVESLSCDATFQMLFTREGRALGVGPARQLPERLRRAIEQRDGGCRVPGCGSTVVHLHHIHHHAHGGVSETWNLVALCPTHHRGLHRGDLRLTGTNADDPDGLTFSTANGRAMVGPLATVTPDAAQRLADLDTSDHVVSHRPEGGRVQWSNVIPLVPPRGDVEARGARSAGGDRASGDDPGPSPDDQSPRGNMCR